MTMDGEAILAQARRQGYAAWRRHRRWAEACGFDADDLGQIAAVAILRTLPRYRAAKAAGGDMGGFVGQRARGAILDALRTELRRTRAAETAPLEDGHGAVEPATSPTMALALARLPQLTAFEHAVVRISYQDERAHRVQGRMHGLAEELRATPRRIRAAQNRVRQVMLGVGR